ncbi:cobalamin B12-binding domain-containing protein [Yoonia vestfoldensis]|jgi:methanogenic corrinoid protein MtbC1|uniref:B12 binding domain protein n=1 Tax=Yoonia vestfoldensis TaxID=245188 RepID=A0A1Y0EHL3_9RHOB|nr:cobalamin B12-binding domain-containing protein [Yoonia vestfoldensis]ARU02871.1 B12 binding domain protein [Yoonia vestfoldensis]
MGDRRNIDVMAGKTPRLPPDSITQAAAAGLTLVPFSTRQLDKQVIAAMRAAVLAVNRDACTHVLQDAITAGIARDDIADFYIPQLARDLGDDWCSDGLSFAAVTIGVSRLQAMLRELGPEWAGDQSANPAAPSIMLIVGQDVYHTLGAMVLSGQLRRKGLSVRLMLGAEPQELAQKLAKTSYDAVFISASSGESLESLRRIVYLVRSSSKTPMPIVIGGTVLEVENHNDVTALTGADHATNVPSEALELCGLTTKYLTIAPQPREV